MQKKGQILKTVAEQSHIDYDHLNFNTGKWKNKQKRF